jgi:hypothetical protein
MLAQKFSIGDTGQPVNELQEFLKRFGYLNTLSLGTFDSMTVDALRQYQQFNGLPVNGLLDSATAEYMNIPRCGVPDDPSNLPTLNFTTNGVKWNKTNLTYQFGSFTPDISQADVKTAIRTAFNLWSKVTPLTFAEINTGIPDILLNFVVSIPGSTAARSSSKTSNNIITDSQIIFDDSDIWALAIPIASKSLDLVDFATHEIGHSLGLGHSPIPTAIMRPSFNSGSSQRSLDQDDIKGIQSIYGVHIPLIAQGDPLGYMSNVPRVVYRGQDNHIHELAIYQNGNWGYFDMIATGAPPANGDPMGYMSNVPRVVYRGQDNHIYEIFINGSGNWSHFDMSMI